MGQKGCGLRREKGQGSYCENDGVAGLLLRADLQSTEDRPEFGRRWRPNGGGSRQAAKTKNDEGTSGYHFRS